METTENKAVKDVLRVLIVCRRANDFNENKSTKGDVKANAKTNVNKETKVDILNVKRDVKADVFII